MPEATLAGEVTLATVWLLGVSMGMTACTVTCLPFMGTWALGRAGGGYEALTHTLAFLGGRIFAYATLGAVAGLVGMSLARALGGNLGNIAIGMASVLAGLWLLWRPPGRTAAPATSLAPIRFHERRTAVRDGLPPVFLGAALSLTPCVPLASLLALAANAGGAPEGAAYGLAFGIGAAATPILVLVPLAGHLGRELKADRSWLLRWLTWGSAAILIVLGVRRLVPPLFA